MSPFGFAPFSFLSGYLSSKVWWLGTQRGQATGSTEERIPNLLGRGWRLPRRGDAWASPVSGNRLEEIRGSCVSDSGGEPISSSGNKGGAQCGGAGMTGPHGRLLFQPQILGWGWFLLIYLISTSSLDRKSSLFPSLGKEPFVSIFLNGWIPWNLEPFSWCFEDSSAYSLFLEWAVHLHFGFGFLWLCLSCFLLLLPQALFPEGFSGGLLAQQVFSESARPIVCSPCFTIQPSYFFTPLSFTWCQLAAIFHMEEDTRCSF